MVRTSVVATAAAVALSACAGHGIVPSSQPAFNPMTSNTSPMRSGAGLSPLAITTCAKSPPQYEWIFTGACAKILLKPAGSSYKLQEYRDITVSGLIGKNDVKGSATIYLAAANANGDIKPYKGKSFPLYKATGKTVVYAVAINQTTQNIKPITGPKPILQYVVTDAHGLPGTQCGAAVLAEQPNHTLKWTGLPAHGPVKGKTVTLNQFSAPPHFELPPKMPLYFAVNCFG